MRRKIKMYDAPEGWTKVTVKSVPGTFVCLTSVFDADAQRTSYRAIGVKNNERIFIYPFLTEELRTQTVSRWIQGVIREHEAKLKLQAQRREAARAEREREAIQNADVPQLYVAGVIVRNSWGYDQTNIEFYRIIERTKDVVKMRRLKTIKTEDGPQTMTGRAVPAEDFADDKIIKRTVKKHEGEEIGFAIYNGSGGGWCKVWSGQPASYSSYA